MTRVVDLFAGWGGFSTGSVRAGCDVVYAANHWPTAVAVHAANHPATAHVCQDLRQADWTALPAYDLLTASPCCTGHSSAGVPDRKRWGVSKKHDSDRATAWDVVDCAEATAPETILVENVPAFRTWQLYPVWRCALETLGYSLQEHLLVASRHGHTPQRRQRLFVVASRRRLPTLRVPEHAEPAIGPCIDWTDGEWRAFGEASPWAQTLLAAAVRKIGPRGLVQWVGGGGGRVRLDEPIRTVTTKDQWCAFADGRYRALTTREYARAMGFPDDYAWPVHLSRADVIRGLGNAVPPGLACAVVSAILEAA